MRKSELNEKQIKEVRLVVEKLQDEWEGTKNWNNIFEMDFSDQTPEAFGRYFGEKANLELGYHAKEEYISLLIGVKDLGEHLTFRLYFGDKLKEILDYIVENKDNITLENYADDFTDKMKLLCKDFILEVEKDGVLKLVKIG